MPGPATSVVRRLGVWRARAHRWVFVRSRGRILSRWGRLPALRLTTTGRVSGRPVHTMLCNVGPPEGPLLLAASDGGAAHDPQWYRNLQRSPEVAVLMAGRLRRMHARIANEDERGRLWPDVVRRSPAYARYQAATARTIPLVLLEEPPSGR